MISVAELETLMAAQDGWRVSIFMPTHRSGLQIEQDPIRLKNLLTTRTQTLRTQTLRTQTLRTQTFVRGRVDLSGTKASGG